MELYEKIEDELENLHHITGKITSTLDGIFTSSAFSDCSDNKTNTLMLNSHFICKDIQNVCDEILEDYRRFYFTKSALMSTFLLFIGS